VAGHGQRARRPTYTVNVETGCWEWQGRPTDDGYGRTRIDGVNTYAHRHYYAVHRGTIPKGLELDHLCRNRMCVNPDHLEAVTPAVNNHRGESTKLTDDDVREIRHLYRSLPLRVIAERFGISTSHACSVARRKLRADVD